MPEGRIPALGVEDRLRSIRIRNFQSIEDTTLDLGALTVVVGKSNSGKSAVLRALKAVARNGVFPSAVRAGSKQFSVELGIGDIDVSIERGKSLSTYRLTDHASGTEEVYTKSGRDVPEDIEAVLGLPKPLREDLTFAGQLDTPYLLSQSPADAAKTLGDLSNVSKLYAAAREANRIRLEAEKMLKVRVADAMSIKEQIADRFADLKEHRSRVVEARETLEDVRERAAKADRLESLIDGLTTAQSAVKDFDDRIASLPTVEDYSGSLAMVEALAQKARGVRGLLDHIGEAYDQHQSAVEVVTKLDAIVETLATQYHDTLKEAGTCPTCNQSTATL